ncbi:MAG: hypothetical protein ACFBSC_20340 [Microcoleaceae cyanobacterium]
MFKVRLLILSSFASGFGLCSIVFALFNLFSEFGVASIFRFLLTSIFFLINLCFTGYYYTLMLRDFRVVHRIKSEVQRISSTGVELQMR